MDFLRFFKIGFWSVIPLFTQPLFAQTNTFPSTGNVGIGTISPAHSLDVHGIIRTHTSFYGSLGDTKYLLRTYNVSATGAPEQFFIRHNFASVDIDNIRGDINFLTDVDFNASIDVSGITTLNNDLKINKSSEALTIKGTGAADITDANFIAFRRSDNLRLGYIGDGSSGGSTLQFVGDFGIQLNALGNVIDLKDDTKVEGMLSITGSVGIGTTTPGNKLEVNGKIRSKEVIVEATGWPDYVFEAGYELPTLAEIEAFLKANKHLPGVPSAKKVEENGLSLGEMNALLLKKIEELTLHIIEQEKRIKKLESNR